MGNMLAYLHEFYVTYYVSAATVWQLIVLASLWVYGIRFLASKNMVAFPVDFLGEKSEKNRFVVTTRDADHALNVCSRLSFLCFWTIDYS